MLHLNNTTDSIFSLLRSHRAILVGLLLVLITAAAYYPVQNFDFVNFDDDLYVYENTYVQGGLTWKGVFWAFTSTEAANWHPITWLSHMLDYELYGLDSGRHHLTSLILHIANVLLLYLVLAGMTRAFWQSVVVAGLFALHPLHVESVAWVSQRKDVLCAFFWMLTTWSYIRWVERPGVPRYLLIVFLFGLGLMAKPMIVTLPFVLILLDYWPLNRVQKKNDDSAGVAERSAFSASILEKIPLFVLLSISCAVTLFTQKNAGAMLPFEDFSLAVRVMNALVSYTHYILAMVYPFKLAAFYPLPEALPLWKVAGALVFLVITTLLAVHARIKAPFVAVGWLWYAGTLVPVIGLIQVGEQAMADRYTYIPLVGIFIIAAWGVPELAGRWRHRRIALATASIAVFSILIMTTHRQVKYWRNGTALFSRALEVTPDNTLVRNNLGMALERQGKTDEAIRHLQEALRLDPADRNAHLNLGNALHGKGRTDDAIRHYREALRLYSDHEKAHYNLGVALYSKGETDEAIRHYREAVRLKPDYEDAHHNLATALHRKGRTDDAIRHYREAVRLEPGCYDAHLGLGNALVRKGESDEAIKHYRETLRLMPASENAHINLGNALARKGQINDAIRHYRQVLGLNPYSRAAHHNLGNALASKGETKEAIRHLQEARRLEVEGR